MLYAVHGRITEKESFSFLRNGEQVTARQVMVAVMPPDPEAGTVGRSAMLSCSFDGEVYADEIIVDCGMPLQLAFAVKAVSIRPQNEGEAIGIDIRIVD